MQSARLLIDGAWISERAPRSTSATSSRVQVIGTVDGASEAQVHAAVAAARRSFLAHPLDGQRRYQLLARTAALLEARRDEFAALITAEGGLPITDATNEVVRTAQTILVSAEEGQAPRRRNGADRVRARTIAPHGLHHPRPPRCGVRHLVVQLAAEHGGAQGRAGARLWQHRGDEAARRRAVVGDALLRAAARGRVPARTSQSRARPGRHAGPVAGGRIRTSPSSPSRAAPAWGNGCTRTSACGLLRSSSAASQPPSCARTPIWIARRRGARRRASAAPGRCAPPPSGSSCTTPCSSRSPRSCWRPSARCKVGDPRDPETDVGPMISEAEAARAEVWVREAVSAGARLLAGGRRDGPVFHPTVLAGVDADAEGRVRGDLRAGPVAHPVQRPRRRRSTRPMPRASACRRAVHQRPHAGAARHTPPALRRRPPQRVVQQSRGPDPVQRRQAERARPRGPEVRDAGNDRGTPGHHQPFVGVSRS